MAKPRHLFTQVRGYLVLELLVRGLAASTVVAGGMGGPEVSGPLVVVVQRPCLAGQDPHAAARAVDLTALHLRLPLGSQPDMITAVPALLPRPPRPVCFTGVGRAAPLGLHLRASRLGTHPHPGHDALQVVNRDAAQEPPVHAPAFPTDRSQHRVRMRRKPPLSQGPFVV